MAPSVCRPPIRVFSTAAAPGKCLLLSSPNAGKSVEEAEFFVLLLELEGKCGEHIRPAEILPKNRVQIPSAIRLHIQKPVSPTNNQRLSLDPHQINPDPGLVEQQTFGVFLR